MQLPLLWHLGRLFSWPHWAAHGFRTILTSLGVALGVATVVGIADVSRSVLAAFQTMVDAVAGEADLEIVNPGGDVMESVVAIASGVDGVASAAGVVEGFVPIAGESESSIYLLGLDFLGSNLWSEQLPRDTMAIEDELEFLAQIDSVAIPRELMERRHLKVGDALGLATPDGVRTVVIRGVIGDAPAAKLFGGAVAVMDLPAAQAVLNRGHGVDRVAVDLRSDVGTDEGSRRLRDALERSGEPAARAFEIASPEVRGRQVEQLLFSLRTTLAIMSLGAVIVGAFIVYHTIAISVLQRRREFALLNASGVGRRVLTKVCVLETLLLAVPGAAIGLIIGRSLALVASGLVADTASQIWLPLYVVHARASSVGAVVGCAIGVLTAVLAAYVAIRASLGAPTIETLRPAGLAVDAGGRVGGMVLVGCILVASSWLVVMCPADLGYVASVTAVVGSHAMAYIGVAVLAAPLIQSIGAWASRTVSGASLPIVLAAQNLPRQPGKSAGTVATIAATMGIAVVVVSLIVSFEAGWMSWIQRHFGADLFVGRGRSVRLIAGDVMGPGVIDAVRATRGVEAVEPFRTFRSRLGDRPVFIQGLSVDVRLGHGGLPLIEGDLRKAAGSIRDGRGVLVSDNLSYKVGLHAGDTVEVPTPLGLRSYLVEGVYIDYLGSLDLGAVLVGQQQLEDVWGDRSANLLRVWLSAGESSEVVKEKIRKVLVAASGNGSEPHYVLEPNGFLNGVRSAVQKFFAATWALEFVAALVGVIGVINTQLATVLDRTGEISVLRTIGLSRKDIVRSVVIECGALGALGGILGVALGLVLGAQIVLVSLKLVTGWTMAFHVPWAQLGVAVLIATAISALAGYIPARAAARVPLGQQGID